MSEQPEGQPKEPAQDPNPEPKQDEIDWKAKAREWEKRAKDNKTAADELAGLKDSQKTAEQRFEERLAELDKRAAAAEVQALRSSVAAEYGISTKKNADGTPSDAELFLTGSDETILIAQAKRLAGREEERKKQGNFAAKEGKTPPAAPDELRDFAKSLFNKE